MKPLQTINIACACDLNFLPYTAAMIASIIENNRHHQLNFYFLYRDIPKREICKLENFIQQKHQTVVTLQISDEKFNKFIPYKHLTRAAYYRLLFSEYFPDIEKILYLDGDIIVRKDIQPFWQTDISNYPIAAIPSETNPEMLQRLQMKPDSKYFNSGVMLINLDWWRQHNISNQVIQYIANNPERTDYRDQQGLNAVIDGNYRYIDKKWNVQSVSFFNQSATQTNPELIQDPSLIHFSGMGRKPWELSSTHPFKKEYVRYQNKTPWKASIFNFPLNFLYRFAKIIKNQLVS